jgi:hypothetical protein
MNGLQNENIKHVWAQHGNSKIQKLDIFSPYFRIAFLNLPCPFILLKSHLCDSLLGNQFVMREPHLLNSKLLQIWYEDAGNVEVYKALLLVEVSLNTHMFL